MTSAGARIWTVRAGVENTNFEAAAPQQRGCVGGGVPLTVTTARPYLLTKSQDFFSFLFFCSSHGISTWMCTDIDGGDTYREEILANVRDAKVFLIFLNEKWATSDECVFEYNYALVRH